MIEEVSIDGHHLEASVEEVPARALESKHNGAALADIHCDAEGVSERMQNLGKQRQPKKFAGRKSFILLLTLMAVFILDPMLLSESIFDASVFV